MECVQVAHMNVCRSPAPIGIRRIQCMLLPHLMQGIGATEREVAIMNGSLEAMAPSLRRREHDWSLSHRRLREDTSEAGDGALCTGLNGLLPQMRQARDFFGHDALAKRVGRRRPGSAL